MKRIKAYTEAGHMTDFGFAINDEVKKEVNKLLSKCLATGVNYDDIGRMLKVEIDFVIVMTRLGDRELNPVLPPRKGKPKA